MGAVPSVIGFHAYFHFWFFTFSLSKRKCCLFRPAENGFYLVVVSGSLGYIKVSVERFVTDLNFKEKEHSEKIRSSYPTGVTYSGHSCKHLPLWRKSSWSCSAWHFWQCQWSEHTSQPSMHISHFPLATLPKVFCGHRETQVSWKRNFPGKRATPVGKGTN